MKKSILVFICFCPLLLTAINLQLTTKLESIYHFSTFDSKMVYSNQYLDYQYLFNDELTTKNTSLFNRKYSYHTTQWQLKRMLGLSTVGFSFISTRNYSNDSGIDTLDSSLSKIRTAMCSYSVNFYDRLHILTSMAMTNYHDNYLDNNGITTNVQSSYQYKVNESSIDCNANLISKHVAKDWKDEGDARFKYSYVDDNREINWENNFYQQKMKIYEYTSVSDIKKKRNYDTRFDYSLHFTESQHIILSCNGSIDNTNYNTAKAKNTALGSYGVNYDYYGTYYKHAFQIGSYVDKEKRDYSSIDYTRRVDTREIHANVHFNTGFLDSLGVFYRTELNQTFYSEKMTYLDNDKFVQSISVKTDQLLNPDIDTKLSFAYLLNKDIYISKKLSANSVERKTYLLIPEVNYALLSCLELKQIYTLRADYEDYLISTSQKNRFYRSILQRYVLSYEQESKNKMDNLICELAFQRENYESADYEEEHYLLNSKKLKNDLELTVKRDWTKLSVIINPKYTWQNDKEILINGELHYILGKQNILILKISPYGQSIQEFDWRWSVQLYYEL